MRRWHSDSVTSRRMSRVRRRGTEPELAVRRLARQAGLSYRLSNADLPGSPDLANRSRRLALFVHGCFWHRHSCRKGQAVPGRNRTLWEAKSAGTCERDRGAVACLQQQGFRVLVVWECELVNAGKVKQRLSLWLHSH